MGAASKRLHLTRHAQAEHNVANDYTIADAPLTALGREQSHELDALTRDSVQRQAELLVCSPMKRPLETMLIGYATLVERLSRSGKPPIILDLLQECGPYPCDTPTYPPSAIQAWNDGLFAHLDFSGLSPDYASKDGIFAPENAAQRAREVRHWLRNRPENEIVVVAHGDILRHLVDGRNSSRQWANAEVKLFTFVADTDPDATLAEVKVEKVPPEATHGPTSGEMEGSGPSRAESVRRAGPGLRA
ncbi:hypothetical protein Q5752_003775 [Cryptotrichosporon argae]